MKSKHAPRYIHRSDRNVFALVQEYCKLSKIMHPSDAEFDQLMAILELAQYDAELCSLINEADHLLAYEMGLSEGMPLENYSLLDK